MVSLFLTGATGFLGGSIIDEIVRTTDFDIYVLVRADDHESACRRLLGLWYGHSHLTGEIGKRIIPVAGDITYRDLGLSRKNRDDLTNNINYIIHAAAEVDIRQKREVLEKINVEGTDNVLYFAEQINKEHPIKRFSFISTAYAAGDLKGRIKEEFHKTKEFLSIYEETKYRAELIAKKYMDIFPVSIFRPSQIVGNSKSGFISRFNTVYYPIRLYMTKRIWIIPASGKVKINLVPVDYVTKAIIKITIDPGGANRIFHLVSDQETLPLFKEMIAYIREWSKKELKTRFRRPVFIRVPLAKTLGKSYNLFYRNKKGSTFSNILSLIPYTTGEKIFDDTNTYKILARKSPLWSEYFSVLLGYAVKAGFLENSGRTVFEQVMHRLGSRKYPVTFHNISKDSMQKVSGGQLKSDICDIVTALLSIGVEKGTRAALIGSSCTRYVSVDIALGLIGAVSVPLYYTLPVVDILKYLQIGGCSVIFIGSMDILNNIKLYDPRILIVSMCDSDVNCLPASNAMTWDEFLDRAENDKVFKNDVRFNDPATIRFTSGTTGDPKGAVFTNYNLKWMAETIASLFAWKVRNTNARYLSYLPMSHVIEGILAAYGSYYNLCRLDIYYLTDIEMLGKMLRKIRPTIFFSVPRVYEKIWDKFSLTFFGKFYLSGTGEHIKRLIKPVLRHILLRKSGLDKCIQLIAGSAPLREELILNFKDMDIDIYNAYGLTEAPLITMNRWGDNSPGTVGKALPETDIVIAPDGEVLVNGPQKAGCYYNDMSQVYYKNGYFKTGDIGEFTYDGKLMIKGRKKEMIITSYGKNIQPIKIENLVMGIRGVINVLLAGDGLPFCSVIIWVDFNMLPHDPNQYFTENIMKINLSLSRPETIRKWAVVDRLLTIGRGELTPSLKPRRAVILENYNDLISSFYTDRDTPGYVRYRGSFHSQNR